MPSLDHLPVAVIGAGPVGLAAAAHLAARDLPFVVVEAGATPAADVRQWGHVRLFSPWSMLVDPAARRLLEARGWQAPTPEGLPTGAEWVARYLEPLAATPPIADGLVLGARVTGVSREGADRLTDRGRSERPFVLHVDGAAPGRMPVRAVIDASGTWRSPNPVGADGLPAEGEREARASGRVVTGIPDVLGGARSAHSGAHTIVVGSGHSAQQVVRDLATLAEQAPGAHATWVVRSESPSFGGGADDELPARGALGAAAREALASPSVDLVAGFGVREVRQNEQGVTVLDGDRQVGPAERVVVVTGFRPDRSLLAELRTDLHPTVEAPRGLAPLIDPNVHSCGTVPPHGAGELAQPEPGLYMVGAKSYGRAPTFLARTGFEQVRSVVADLAGDTDAAQRVELVLPETGVCGVTPEPSALEELDRSGSARPLPVAALDGGGCC